MNASVQLTCSLHCSRTHLSNIIFTKMSTTTTTTAVQPAITLQAEDNAKQTREPLLLSGALDRFKHEESTPVIGREYVDVNLVNDIINAENSDDLIRDLAITSSSYRKYVITSALTYVQSHSVAWCSSVHKTTSPTTSRKHLSSVSVN